MPVELPRRRNGRPQACEPCRKRKIACDHGLPICQRCKQRKMASACVYHAAPMTQRPDMDQDIPNISSLPVLDTVSSRLRRLSDSPAAVVLNGTVSTCLTDSSVFFGPTSFSAVFHENEEDLGPALNPGERDMEVDHSLQKKAEVEHVVLDANLVRLGTKVLGLLPDQQTCNTLLKRHIHTNNNDGWFKPATQYILDTLWSIYGKHLSASKSMNGIEAVARILCENARIELEEPVSDDPKEWLDSFSGHNMRWEALGLLFKSCCYGALASPDTESYCGQDGRQRERRIFVREMQECVSICVTLCSHTEYVNPVMVALFYNNCLLLSILGAGGDTSFLLWRYHGDLISATTAVGLHREPDLRDKKICIEHEIRRRIYASVFAVDKFMASFTGRPPFLSHRYSSCSMPLDIDDEVWFMDEDNRAKAIAGLTPEGWNADGRLTTTTYLRVNMYMALIRDEILEISLGSWNECLPNCIFSLRDRSEKEYSEFPENMKYHPGDLFDRNISDMSLTLKMCCRLAHLQNLFLLERLAIKYRETAGQTLLDIAREMLGLTLLLYTHRDRFIGDQHNFEWLIVCYGVPASGVLCFELLKQSRHPQAPRLKLPRSETVQNLSLFIGFLNWVRPNAANYEVCCKMKAIVSRVLDQILEGPVAPSSSQQEQNTVQSHEQLQLQQHQQQPQQQQQNQQNQQQHQTPSFNFDAQMEGFDFDALGDFDIFGDTDWMKAPWWSVP